MLRMMMSVVEVAIAHHENKKHTGLHHKGGRPSSSSDGKLEPPAKQRATTNNKT
jgi:hypothetical protein